jgi:hypothetical protein
MLTLVVVGLGLIIVALGLALMLGALIQDLWLDDGPVSRTRPKR